MKLSIHQQILLHPTASFAFDPTFHKPDHFATEDNEWQPGIRWQTWLCEGKPLGLKFVNESNANNPSITLHIYSNAKLSQKTLDFLTYEVRYRYNLDIDLDPFYRQFEKDKILGPIIKKWNGMRPGHPGSLYEYLIIGVVLQNATVRRSIQMFKNLIEKYGTKLEFDGKILWCFWKPGALHNVLEEELRLLKIGYRAKFIKRIDDYFYSSAINEQQLRTKDQKTQMEELLKLYGVGPATVWYLLFDVFHHWDFFNHISPWEQKIYSKLFFNKDPENPVTVEKLLKYFERFGKYKQLAVHYIWEDL
ncbi:hypothetical protein HZB78_02600 [Candidatus Collierbacteria bacterium]|nr:hypothetical protein [Candidatus Collierbacteria bacterium]